MEIVSTKRQTAASTSNLTKILGSFLEVITHEILFTCSLYPFDAFSPTRHYGVTCHACRHPDVVDYVFETLKVAVPGIISGIVDELSIIMYDSQTDKLLERYTFEFDLDESVKIAEMDSSTIGPATVSERKLLDEVLLSLERSLRDVLLRVVTLDGTDLGRRKRGEKRFSPSATFKICVHTKILEGRNTECNNGSSVVGKYPELQGAIEEGKWLMADEGNCNFSNKSNNVANNNVHENDQEAGFVMRPLKSVNVPSCGMNIQLLMERLK